MLMRPEYPNIDSDPVNTEKSAKPVNLFWTGGWDSSFRLLQIVLEEKRAVHPFYIVYAGRPSFQHEIDAMVKIRTAIGTRYPFSAPLILPTSYSTLEDINDDEEIMEAFWRANEERFLAMQNAWLAKFCKQHQITDMEYGIIRRPFPQDSRFYKYLIKENGSSGYIYNPDLYHLPEYTLFRYFRFPIFDYSKKDIEIYARQKGWLDILKKSWFCYTPIIGRYPCGTCFPCSLVLKSDIRWRIPMVIRILNRLSLIEPLRTIYRKIKSILSCKT